MKWILVIVFSGMVGLGMIEVGHAQESGIIPSYGILRIETYVEGEEVSSLISCKHPEGQTPYGTETPLDLYLDETKAALCQIVYVDEAQQTWYGAQILVRRAPKWMTVEVQLAQEQMLYQEFWGQWQYVSYGVVEEREYKVSVPLVLKEVGISTISTEVDYE